MTIGVKDGTVRERVVYALAQFVRDLAAGGVFVTILTAAISAARDANLIGVAIDPTADPNAVIAGGGLMAMGVAVWRVLRPYVAGAAKAAIELRPGSGTVDVTASVEEYMRANLDDITRAAVATALDELERRMTERERAAAAPAPIEQVPADQRGEEPTVVISAGSGAGFSA